ncbi:MAG: hypothetical protein IH968_12710 [Gemmatimonadetes bacterium]|nr:hypothetical protein [Gemmatimonadota bacterium]
MLHWTSGALLIAGAALITTEPPAQHAVQDGAGGLPALPSEPRSGADEMFLTGDRCLGCHKGVVTSEGIDVSIGYDWRATMMANSARDPYWQAAVRREILDYPEAASAIEDKCSRCHMPMANASARAAGRPGVVFGNLPVGRDDADEAGLAADGVSCTACHQITPSGLGSEASFTGGFRIATETPAIGRTVFGPFEPDTGGQGIMHSATGFRPTEGAHVQSSDLCATCHTVFTHSLRPNGEEGPEFPEQTPYLEWRGSAAAAEGTSCQDCHMPEVGEDVPVTRVLGRPRSNVSRHVFRGGNFFMLRMLNRYREELGVTALPHELSLAADRTERHLREATVFLSVSAARVSDGQLEAVIEVRNLTGHKFPTAYPSRRAWLHVTIRDGGGRSVFESGAFSSDGRVAGSDNDQNPTRYEPHYTEITSPDQVQIYEAIMLDGDGRVTTGLMSAERWAKDNRLLPAGFERSDADPRVAVFGQATSDADFQPGLDRIRYAIDVDPARGPFTVVAELWFQPIAYRWAQNLAEYESMETQRFTRYYQSMSSSSALVLAADSTVVR